MSELTPQGHPAAQQPHAVDAAEETDEVEDVEGPGDDGHPGAVPPTPAAEFGVTSGHAPQDEEPLGEQAEPSHPEVEDGEEPAEAPAQAADAEEAGPRPLGVEITPTGHRDVDGRLRRLTDADHLAVSGHLEVYEDVHRGLRETLAALDRSTSRS